MQKQLTQDLLHVPRREPPLDRNRRAFAGVLIHHREHLEGPTILGALHPRWSATAQ